MTEFGTPKFVDEVGCAVDDLRLVPKILRPIDHAKEANDPFHVI